MLVHGLFLDNNDNLGRALSDTVQVMVTITEWYVIPYPIDEAVKIRLYDRNGSTSHSRHLQVQQKAKIEHKGPKSNKHIICTGWHLVQQSMNTYK